MDAVNELNFAVNKGSATRENRVQSNLARVRRAPVRTSLVAVSALLGIVSCTAPGSSIKDYQAKMDAAMQASKLAREQGEQAARQAAGVVSPTQRRSADGVEVVLTTGHTGGVISVGVSADGRYIISSDSKEIKVWEAASHN